jgi:hypothetical protein
MVTRLEADGAFRRSLGHQHLRIDRLVWLPNVTRIEESGRRLGQQCPYCRDIAIPERLVWVVRSPLDPDPVRPEWVAATAEILLCYGALIIRGICNEKRRDVIAR